MRTQEDNPGKAAVATVKVLFFKNVRLLSMRDHHCNVIRAKMKGAIITTDICRYKYVEIIRNPVKLKICSEIALKLTNLWYHFSCYHPHPMQFAALIRMFKIKDTPKKNPISNTGIRAL